MKEGWRNASGVRKGCRRKAMLQELLKLIAQGDAHSQRHLARRLEVSEGLVKQMLEYLTRIGHLEHIAGYTEECAACPLAKMCICEETL